MLLPNLKIKNFRSFHSLEIEQLGNINLIVGQNNSGKSTLLEAIRVFCSKGEPTVLNEIASNRGEVTFGSREIASNLLDTEIFESMFSDRRFNSLEEEGIYIGDIDSENYITIKKALLAEFQEVVKAEDGEIPRVRRRVISNNQLLETYIEAADRIDDILLVNTQDNFSKIMNRQWISFDEMPSDHSTLGARKLSERWSQISAPIPFSYVPTRMLGISEIGALWDKVTLTDFEAVVIDALKVIDDRIAGIAFVEHADSKSSPRRPNSGRTALLRMKGVSTRTPLSSSGDGVARLLQIILCLYAARNGFLLIDEFENGLHYSVQEKIWDSIFYQAKKLNVQVFATTHSSDTLKAFTKAASQHDSDGSLINLAKSAAQDEEGLTIATIYGKRELHLATSSDIDLR